MVGLARFPSKRLDDQLRGRAGRQGDPGRSVFFTSLEDDLVLKYAPDHAPIEELEEDGRIIGGRKVLKVMDHAQRVSEGQEQSLRDLSRRYGRLLTIYRKRLLTLREEILKRDRVTMLLLERIPECINDLEERVLRSELEDATRIAILVSLNKSWSDFLEFATSIREGIHLRVLAREDPLLGYEKLIAEEAEGMVETILTNSADALLKAPVRKGKIILDQASQYNPGSTWTYAVTDDHFGSELERFARALRRVYPRIITKSQANR